MNAKLKLNETNLKKLTPDGSKQVVFWDQTITGFGLRVSPGGSKTFFYQDRLNGRSLKITIGKYGKVAPEQARKEAKRLQAEISLGTNPSPVKDQSTTKNSAGKRLAKDGSEIISLGQLLTFYVEQLKAEGKNSAASVQNQLRADIEKPFPKLWDKDAREVTLKDCRGVIRRLISAGRRRQADKLRSYIKSAYKRAINAPDDLDAPEELGSFGILQSPISEMMKVKGSNQSKDRALSLAELRAYWGHLKDLSEPKRSIAMLHVLTGGQRQDQFRRCTFDDLDHDQGSITIYDIKGARDQARRHVVPLTPICLELIKNIGSGPYILSADGGRTPMGGDYLRKITIGVCKLMKEAGQLEKAPFTAGTLRATIETRLSGKPYNVSKDIRGQLLSHGLSGVQDKHYQKYEFFDEKLDCLEMIYQMVEGAE